MSWRSCRHPDPSGPAIGDERLRAAADHADWPALVAILSAPFSRLFQLTRRRMTNNLVDTSLRHALVHLFSPRRGTNIATQLSVRPCASLLA